jgi:hypothetical protein
VIEVIHRMEAAITDEAGLKRRRKLLLTVGALS